MVRYGLEELDAGGLDVPAGLVVGLGRDGHRLPGHEGRPRQGQRGGNGAALEGSMGHFAYSHSMSTR